MALDNKSYVCLCKLISADLWNEGKQHYFKRKSSCTGEYHCRIATRILMLSLVDCVWFGCRCCVVADGGWAIILNCVVLGGHREGFVKHIFGAWT